MDVYALRVDEPQSPLVLETQQSSTVVMAVFDSVPPGVYHVLAYNPDPSLKNVRGAFTRAVVCGETANCIDHSLVDIHVGPGQEVTGVVIGDYFASSIPARPPT